MDSPRITSMDPTLESTGSEIAPREFDAVPFIHGLTTDNFYRLDGALENRRASITRAQTSSFGLASVPRSAPRGRARAGAMRSAGPPPLPPRFRPPAHRDLLRQIRGRVFGISPNTQASTSQSSSGTAGRASGGCGLGGGPDRRRTTAAAGASRVIVYDRSIHTSAADADRKRSDRRA